MSSPTWAAVASTPITSQMISITEGCIAVSPDGRTIAYFGWDLYFAEAHVCLLHTNDGTNYSFTKSPIIVASGPGEAGIDIIDGLQFTSNIDLYCAGRVLFKTVHHFKFQEAYCENPRVTIWESKRS